MTTQYCAQCGAKLEADDRFCTECGAPQSGNQARSLQMMQPRNQFPMPMLLLAVGVLLLVGGMLVYLFNRPEAGPVAANAPTNASESDIPYPDVVRIPVEEAWSRYEAGTAVIVDVRPLEDYQTLHAANALSLPLAEIADRYPELPQDKEILTYCT